MNHDDFIDSFAEDRLERERFDRQRDWDDRLHELELRDLTESVECEEAKWSHRMKVWAAEREQVHYRESRRGLDEREFGT